MSSEFEKEAEKARKLQESEDWFLKTRIGQRLTNMLQDMEEKAQTTLVKIEESKKGEKDALMQEIRERAKNLIVNIEATFEHDKVVIHEQKTQIWGSLTDFYGQVEGIISKKIEEFQKSHKTALNLMATLNKELKEAVKDARKAEKLYIEKFSEYEILANRYNTMIHELNMRIAEFNSRVEEFNERSGCY